MYIYIYILYIYIYIFYVYIYIFILYIYIYILYMYIYIYSTYIYIYTYIYISFSNTPKYHIKVFSTIASLCGLVQMPPLWSPQVDCLEQCMVYIWIFQTMCTRMLCMSMSMYIYIYIVIPK